jgi:hypothetical protein
MTNWVPESKLEPAVGHATDRYRGIGYPESLVLLVAGVIPRGF